ncbi:MAG: FAD/NAD(P)-binding protein [Hyphomicrobium sp.]|uniref:FAD/NAD(P)-binding protein n=1 Tax=Hyphomicrobium sp. TaxID=82 RepID=UPI00132A3858|nr:FAD/NAD(P)-binding protein [Hyphomicrobium sp.]KAB2943483.1 MAG: Ni/Fe hydrogenase subunit gamma [Hyphomicrobium sp.]MBZ0210727.1 FAD/NAD(P)-binding protein [Hyphomicrobium sp.]
MSDMHADPMLPLAARVRHNHHEVGDIWTLDLDLGGASLPAFVPGQFNMLSVPGVGEVPISMSGDPADQSRLVHTVRAVGPVSRALTALRAGDAIGLRGPFGVGWPMADAADRDVIVIAGGLGLAPLRPALYRLLAERAQYGKIWLYYGTRSPDDILFGQELHAWRARFDMDVEVTVDHAPATWHGHVGVVTTLIPRAGFDPARTVALVCGPEIMMRFAITALRDAAMQDSSIHLSMERNMKCAIGLCGHCQFAPVFVCRDGPVFRHDRISRYLALKEI